MKRVDGFLCDRKVGPGGVAEIRAHEMGGHVCLVLWQSRETPPHSMVPVKVEPLGTRAELAALAAAFPPLETGTTRTVEPEATAARDGER
jgi:hypothetical protein